MQSLFHFPLTEPTLTVPCASLDAELTTVPGGVALTGVLVGVIRVHALMEIAITIPKVCIFAPSFQDMIVDFAIVAEKSQLI